MGIKQQILATIFMALVISMFLAGSAGAQSSDPDNPTNKKIPTWRISEAKSGGLRGKTDGYSIDSYGHLVDTKDSKQTTRKVTSAELAELGNILVGLRLPGTKTRMVKGDGIYDGVYGGLTITLDGKDYKIEGNSFYAERQLVLSASQKAGLEQLKQKLAKIRTGR